MRSEHTYCIAWPGALRLLLLQFKARLCPCPLPPPRLSYLQVVTAAAEAKELRQRLAANPVWQAVHGGGDTGAIQLLRRKAELLVEASQIQRRMKESQLTTCVRLPMLNWGAGVGWGGTGGSGLSSFTL